MNRFITFGGKMICLVGINIEIKLDVLISYIKEIEYLDRIF